MFNLSEFSGSFIDDQFLHGSDSITVIDKYSQEFLGEVATLKNEQYETVLSSSHRAFDSFQDFDSAKRSKLLFQLADALEDEGSYFASLISKEAGKPISYATQEVSRCVDTIRLSAELTKHHYSENQDLSYGKGRGKIALTKKYPEGIVFCLSPFNFPLNLALHKIAPALAVGCAVIIKPSPMTPITLLAFGKLLSKVGFPKGIVNIVICDNQMTQRFVEDKRIAVLSFTGSAPVGWMLKSKAVNKKCILELGGNAAAIVNDSQDLPAIVEKLVFGSFLYSGQICISTQRIYIASSIFHDFLELFLEQLEDIISGDIGDSSVINGPLINSASIERIHSWVQEAITDGADLLAGGHIIDEVRNIYAPTILTNTGPDMKVVAEEVFGPVVILEPYDSFSDAIELVNDSRYGLQAGVFTDSLVNIKEAINRINVGGLIFNEAPGFRMDAMPYGGIKDSGYGREGTIYTMNEYTREKLVLL